MLTVFNMIELQEFYRLRSSFRAKKEHASLLEDFREFDRSRLDLEEGGGSEQVLLKEHASISRSTGQVQGNKCSFLSYLIIAFNLLHFTLSMNNGPITPVCMNDG